MGWTLWEGLVREAPTDPVEENVVESDEISEMATTEIKEEVRQALKKTKDWKNNWNRWYPSGTVQSRWWCANKGIDKTAE